MSSAFSSPGLYPAHSLSTAHRDEMFLLLSDFFSGVSREQFELDLAQKNWVLVLLDSTSLVGFSTLLITEVVFEGSTLTVIYSGDTIVAPMARNKSTLAKLWIASVNAIKNSFPNQACYWLLLTSGFRTYRFLPVFWKTFFPRFDCPTPPDQLRLLQFLANYRYHPNFDADCGLVRFPRPQKLRAQSGEQTRASDAHVAFFLKHNPGHLEGDELVCLCEISEENLTPAGERMVRP